jgi:hypothetical protein
MHASDPRKSVHITTREWEPCHHYAVPLDRADNVLERTVAEPPAISNDRSDGFRLLRSIVRVKCLVWHRFKRWKRHVSF